MGIVRTEELVFDYIRRDEDGNVEDVITAIDNVDITVRKGQFVAILGHNGSGKSTLARHFNALLIPTEGVVRVDGMDTADENNLWKIRQTAGMVFQNPDNQMIGVTVEEEVAFGPENLGVPSKEIRQRVDNALKAVHMSEYRKQSPARLSGGQKQRVAIAGVLAMQPECIVLDEPTAMIDPKGRKEVIEALKELNEKENVTVILITHAMEEAVLADKIFVMDSGKIAMEGTPREVFSHVEEMDALRLEVPVATALAHGLRKKGYHIREDILTSEELVEAICRLY